MTARRFVAVVCAVVGAHTVGGCATTPPSPPPPVFSVDADDVGPKGTACGAKLQKSRGARPANARVVAVLSVTADQPVPLEALEQVLVVAALRRCATGLAILRASAADGADGFVDAAGEAWEVEVEPPAPVPTPTAAPPSSASSSSPAPSGEGWDLVEAVTVHVAPAAAPAEAPTDVPAAAPADP